MSGFDYVFDIGLGRSPFLRRITRRGDDFYSSEELEPRDSIVRREGEREFPYWNLPEDDQFRGNRRE